MLRLTSENPSPSGADIKGYNSKGLRLLGARADVDDVINRAVRPESVGRPQPIAARPEFLLASELDPDQEPFIVGQAWKALRRSIVDGSECRANFAEGLFVHQVLDAAEGSAVDGSWARVDPAHIPAGVTS